MNQRVLKEFFNRVDQEQKYLAYGDFSFEELLKKSMKDRRVRNVFVFYALSKPEYYHKFLALAEKKYTVQRLKTSLYQALCKVEKDQVYRQEMKHLAKAIRNKYFHQSQVVALTGRREYDESKEMEKFFVSVVNYLLNEKEVNPKKDAYVADRMKEVDFDNLFVTK